MSACMVQAAAQQPWPTFICGPCPLRAPELTSSTNMFILDDEGTPWRHCNARMKFCAILASFSTLFCTGVLAASHMQAGRERSLGDACRVLATSFGMGTCAIIHK